MRPGEVHNSGSPPACSNTELKEGDWARGQRGGWLGTRMGRLCPPRHPAPRNRCAPGATDHWAPGRHTHRARQGCSLGKGLGVNLASPSVLKSR